MECIHGRCSPFLLSRSCSRGHSRRSKVPQFLWQRNYTRSLRGNSHLSLQPQALGTSPLILAIKSPASSGDYSVFVPISAALFFIYWIANFVVPDIIYKDFSSEESTAEQTLDKTGSIGEGNGSMANGTDSSQQTKKRSVKKKSSKLQ